MDKAISRDLVMFGILGVGGYFFITKILPDLLKNLGKGAGDTAAGAATGIAQGAGTAAGGLIMAAPNAINALVEYVTGYPNAIGSLGEAIGAGIFKVFNWNPTGEMLYFNVGFPDGQHHAVASTMVNSRGQFVFGGRNYQMLVGQDGHKYATLL